MDKWEGVQGKREPHSVQFVSDPKQMTPSISLCVHDVIGGFKTEGDWVQTTNLEAHKLL